MKWSVLDQSPSSAGSTQDVAIRESIALAQHCDALGYERYCAGVEEALSLYRRNYRPTERYPRPQATICVWALAADSEAEARRLLKTREYWRAGFEKGLRLPLESPQHAAAYPYSDAERVMIDKLRAKALVGDAAQVADKLTALARKLELDEIVINTWTFDAAARRHSYELLAEAFGLVTMAGKGK